MIKQFSIKNHKLIIIFVVIITTILIIYTILKIEKLHIIYNETPSVPVGFYIVHPLENEPLFIGEYLEFNVPENYKSYFYDRKYIGNNWTLIKQIGALEGDNYCINRQDFSINNNIIGNIYKVDSLGRILPINIGCRQIFKDKFFALGANSDKSFDSRYMGQINKSLIIGKAIPLWIF
ncbi:MAG: S26 family signal peptidase [Pseudomonadota bacterium]